jgi:hypothetical protein
MSSEVHHIKRLDRGDRGRLLPLELTPEQVIAQLIGFLRDLPPDALWGVKTVRQAPGGLYDRLNKFFPKEVGKRGSVNWQSVCDLLDSEYVDRFQAKGITINDRSRWSENRKESNLPKRQKQVIHELIDCLQNCQSWSPGFLKNSHSALYDRLLRAFPDTNDRWNQVLKKIPKQQQKKFTYVLASDEDKLKIVVTEISTLLSTLEKPQRIADIVKENRSLRTLITSYAPRTEEGFIDWNQIKSMIDPAVREKLVIPNKRLELDRMLFKGEGLQDVQSISPSMIMSLPKRRIWELSKKFPSNTQALDWRTLYRSLHPQAKNKWHITDRDFIHLSPRKDFKDEGCESIKASLEKKNLIPYRKSLFEKPFCFLNENEKKVLGVLFDEISIGNITAFSIFHKYIQLHNKEDFKRKFETDAMKTFFELPDNVIKKRLIRFVLSTIDESPNLNLLFIDFHEKIAS